MEISEYLCLHQKVIYKTFTNSLKRGNLSHAYLISGEIGTPIFEVAKELAKTLLCDQPNPLACNECVTCKRINDNNYPDFLIFDGSKETIKKEDMIDLEMEFDKTAFERKSKKIYIINQVENMTTQAINTILKFLEEPGKDIYAFLTTYNIMNVLPTIVSRCQNFKLLPMDKSIIIKQAIQDNVPSLDAELLSYFYNEPTLLKEAYENDKNYVLSRDALLDILNLLNSDLEEAFYQTERRVSSIINKKEAGRFFFDLLTLTFEDLIQVKVGNEPVLQSIRSLLQDLAIKLPHIEDSLIEILKSKKAINANINLALLIDHTMNFIIKE